MYHEKQKVGTSTWSSPCSE